MDIQEKLSTIPDRPGVYIFRDRDNKILYVGKAKALKSRVRTYFQKSSDLDMRKGAMVQSVADFEYTVTGNELEAFVLEANLIKQYRPRYNVLLRDDKNYPYLKLTLNEKWPRLEVVRRIKKDGSRYFGPYVPSGAMWSILSFIRNNFRFPNCKYSLEKRLRPCIQHQIKKCDAPCAGLVDHHEYMNTVNEIRLLLEGKNRGLLDTLQKRMEILSDELRFEEAAQVRDRISAIRKVSESQKVVAPGLGDIDIIGLHKSGEHAVVKILFTRNGIMIGSRHFLLRDLSDETDSYLMKNFIGQFYAKEIIPPPDILCSELPEDAGILHSWLSEKRGSLVHIAEPVRGLKKGLVRMAEENAEILLKSEKEHDRTSVLREVAAMLGLSKTPEDIGAFDISNISGSEPVGAFVYWADGGFKKEKYRHIKMDAVKGPDDYAMMQEMVSRTISNLEGIMPDLVIIDGGKGQLEAALKSFTESGVETGVISIAKDPDRVFMKDSDGALSIEDGRPASLLLKRIRDEVHRFAISYHKKLRAKRTYESPLEKIPGIGRKRRLELLRHFSGIDAIRNAGVEEIAAIKGFNRKIAEKVIEGLAAGAENSH